MIFNEVKNAHRAPMAPIDNRMILGHDRVVVLEEEDGDVGEIGIIGGMVF